MSELDDLTRPFNLIESHTTVQHDFPTIGAWQQHTSRTRYGSFTSVKEYQEKRAKLIAQRQKEGWRLSDKPNIYLERIGGEEIRYFYE